jgi:hypothetical protein
VKQGYECLISSSEGTVVDENFFRDSQVKENILKFGSKGVLGRGIWKGMNKEAK